MKLLEKIERTQQVFIKSQNVVCMFKDSIQF